MAMNGFRAENLEGEDIEDEVTRLLGGADEDLKMKPMARDFVSMERTLSRLLRVKRSVVTASGGIYEDEEDMNAILSMEIEVASKSTTKKCARGNGLF